MNLRPASLEGVFHVEHKSVSDVRGSFLKIWARDNPPKSGLPDKWAEVFVTRSKQNVLRGMHFQEAPADHEKLVTVLDGEVLDVVLDIRKSSKTFGSFFAVTLTSTKPSSLYLPKGVAHGFLVTSSHAVVHYLTTSVHCPDKDKGIHWDSFGFQWPVDNPILSERDKVHPSLNSFKGLLI